VTPIILEAFSPEMQLGRKLEGIFLPETRKRRDEYYTRSRKMAHYTSAEAALKIIGTKRIWMRNTTCMADSREVEYGHEMLVSFFSRERERFVSALQSIAPGAAMEIFNLFDRWWATPQFRFSTYVSSMAEHDDSEDLNGRLSMWRGFGGTPGRVALVFQIPVFPDAADLLNLVFSPVAYTNESKVYTSMNTVIENIKANADFLRTLDRQIILGWLFLMLSVGVTCVKHEGFSEEKEWRAIYQPGRAASPLMACSTEVVGGIPQIIYKIPLHKSASPMLEPIDFAVMFDRLIVGPSPFPWAMYEAFVDALTKAGVTDAAERIRISEIPLRGY
jgi:Protein of unknown function (DUF2971)